MPRPTLAILVVGLSRSVLGVHTPRINAFAAAGEVREISPVFPAVTCPVQASMLTGRSPGDAAAAPGHGVVGNGWYNRELGEVHFWKQSNRLIAGEKVWETARRIDPSVTTANLFWWFNMHTTADIAVTPRPVYKADGRKIPDCWTQPASLRDRLQAELGRFPLFNFWGPGSSIASSRWIADAARLTLEWHNPTLTLVYLPHLDYALQKHGPGGPEAHAAAREVDEVVGGLLDACERRGIHPLILSEYGIEPASTHIPINRLLREAGFLTPREEDERELLEPASARAFAVADHQAAHVYVADPADVPAVRSLLAGVPGVAAALAGPDRAALHLDHSRAGDVVCMAAAGHWFSYGWWLDDGRAPDFARTVDIHRKPGYDPLELFIDPRFRSPRLAVGRRLALRRLGFRTLLDVIPLDPSLVRGTHGRVDVSPDHRPLLITQRGRLDLPGSVPCTAVRDVLLTHLFPPVGES